MIIKRKAKYIIGGALLLWGFSLLQHYLFFGSFQMIYPTSFNMIGVILSVFVSPLIEEIIFRNFLMNFLCDFHIRKRYVLLFSSFVFMLAHCMNQGFIYYMLSYFIGGLIFGTVHLQCHDNYSSILCHSLYNFCVLLPILI